MLLPPVFHKRDDPCNPRSIESRLMAIDFEIFTDIAGKAIYPDEWHDRLVKLPNPKGHSQAARLMKRWKHLVTLSPQQDYQDFEQRLEDLGLSQASALERLQTRCCLTDETLPFWAKQLQAILNQAIYPPPASLHSLLSDFSNSKTPLFPNILHPFLYHYLKVAQDKSPNWSVLIAPAVWNNLMRYLLIRLSDLAARVIAADIKQKSVLGRLRGTTSEERYQYYVNKVRGTADGLANLLQKYPVLARLLVAVTEQAISTTGDWLQRVAADCQAITDTFTGGAPVGLVTDANPGLSDPHNGGETVWYVQFESGLRLAYKPRSLAPDLAYIRFLQWLNQQQPTLTLKAAPVLAHLGYGWVQWIETSECDSKEEVALYYRRQGAHIALFYFLGGSDFHEENFVAAGPFPVPIDLEALGAWALSQTSPNSVDDTTTGQLPYFWRTYDSIFSTVMLPRWFSPQGADVEALVMSALSEQEDKDLWPQSMPVWHNLETDEISLKFEYCTLKPACPLPRYQGQAMTVTTHVDEVLRGFTQTYQTVLAHQNDLLSTSSPLTGFEDLPTRALIRPTQSYADTLFFTTAPDNLISGAAYDVALEMVCGVPIFDEQREGTLTYTQAEKRALWDRDIPYFFGSTSDCYLYVEAGDRFGPVNTFSGCDNIRKRIQTASEVDLHWQRELLRASLAMMLAKRGEAPKSSVSVTLQTDQSLDTAVVQHLYGHTVKIAQYIENQVLHHSSGIGWLTLSLHSRSSFPRLEHALPWLGSGNTGIAVFLANLAAYTKDCHWASLARQAIETTTKLVEQQKLQAALVQNGLYCGMAGVLYGLQTCATKLENKDYLRQARRLALSVSVETWGRMQNPNIIGGAAASLLALLNLYNEKIDNDLLERAIAVGRGILSYQEQTGANAGGFRIPTAPRPLLGMGYGTSGIVYALSRLYAITSDPNLERAIQQGLAYERSHFDNNHQNWPSFGHDTAKPQFMTGFCGGAAGLGLARLKMLHYYQDDKMQTEIEIACQATLRQARYHNGSHHLCCGKASQIIFLCQAAQQLQRNDLFDNAVVVAEQMLTSYEKKGYWHLGSLKVRSIVPGLTDGVAGIGLALMTAFDPKATSCVLSLS